MVTREWSTESFAFRPLIMILLFLFSDSFFGVNLFSAIALLSTRFHVQSA